MLKLQQLRAAMSEEQKQAEIERKNHPMRRTFNILAQVNRDLHDALPVVTPQEKEEVVTKDRNRRLGSST